MKLTEDQVVQILKAHLESQGWDIGDRFCLGSKRGIDIEACKNGKTLMIEVKGAKASDTAPTKKRKHFDSGQIKTHFGKALVKVLHDKYLNQDSNFAIAHPDDADIRRAIGHLIPFLKALSIRHFWVSPTTVTED